MPSTKRMVTMLLLNANGWNRDGDHGIVPVLNDAQNLLMEVENEQALKLEDGEFPYLTTVDGTYEYEIDDVWRIGQVLVKYNRQGQYGWSAYYDYGYRNEFVRRNDKVNYRGKMYMRVKQISTTTRVPGNTSSNSTKAKIIFNSNPGDTTDVFLYRGYELPTQITSENIPLSIPTEQLQLSALFPSAQLLIEAYQKGNWDEVFTKIETVYKPMVRRQLNAGEQGVSHTITRREE